MTETSRAVFLSYATQDADAAKRICDALRKGGPTVYYALCEIQYLRVDELKKLMGILVVLALSTLVACGGRSSSSSGNGPVYTEMVLHSFGSAGDGTNPRGSLI